MRHKLILLFWLLALGLTTALLLSNRNGAQNIKLELPKISETQKGTLSEHAQKVQATSNLIEPRFTGKSADGKQWDIRAKQASRSGAMQEDEIVLINVIATVNTASIKPLTFYALRGNYQSQTDALNLTGNVKVTGYGLALSTPQLSANMNTQNLTAGSPVLLEGTGTGWHGTLTAPHLTLNQPGPLLKLTGGVKGQFTFNEKEPTL